MLRVQIGIRISPLNGYMNIDLAGPQNDQRVYHAEANKLEYLIDANEVEEWIAHDSLDYLPLQARAEILKYWMTKIAHNGKLIIRGTDPYEAARLIHSNAIDLGQTNNILYGIGKKSMIRPNDNVDFIMSTGQFTIEDIKYDNMINYTVIAVRK